MPYPFTVQCLKKTLKKLSLDQVLNHVKSFLGTFVLQQKQPLYTPSNMAQVHWGGGGRSQSMLQAALSCITCLIDKTNLPMLMCLMFDFVGVRA